MSSVGATVVATVSQQESDTVFLEEVYEYVLRMSAARSFSMASLNSMVEKGPDRPNMLT